MKALTKLANFKPAKTHEKRELGQLCQLFREFRRDENFRNAKSFGTLIYANRREIETLGRMPVRGQETRAQRRPRETEFF